MFSRKCEETCRTNDEDDSKWPHNLRVSRANIPHLEKVYANLRRQLKREPEDKMDDLYLNAMIRGTFMLVTQQAAVSLGQKLFGELTFNQKPATRNNETIVRSNQEASQ